MKKSDGNHAVFSHPSTAARVTVPTCRPIKPIYIKQFVALDHDTWGPQNRGTVMKKIPAFENYPFQIERLSPENGGGYLIRFPTLMGCVSDGESAAEAIANGRGAFTAWMDSAIEKGAPIPQPQRTERPLTS